MFRPDTSPDASALMLLEEQPRRVIERGCATGFVALRALRSRLSISLAIRRGVSSMRWANCAGSGSIQRYSCLHRSQRIQARTTRMSEKIALDDCISRDRAYFLFGKRLDQKALDRIGPAAQSGDFAEVRIPRLLRYPQLPTSGRCGTSTTGRARIY